MQPQQASKKLRDRLAELIKRDKALEKHLRGEDGRLDEDFSDRVAFTEMDEVIEQLDDAARAEITQIRAALERIEGGSWGTCAKCGSAIGEGRLGLMPHTPFCVSCAG